MKHLLSIFCPLFFLGFASTACLTSARRPSLVFSELSPRPDPEALWSSCGRVDRVSNASGAEFIIGGGRFRIGKTLGQGGKGIVKELVDVDQVGRQLVVKELYHAEDANSVYEDLILHSTMEILGVPTPKAGVGYWLDEANVRHYILVKELVNGPTFNSMLFKLSLGPLAFFDENLSEESRARMAMAGRIYSRIINAGIYISDMHSRNLMWDDTRKVFMMVDGNIEPTSLTKPVNPKVAFGRAVGFLGAVGDRIFYDRFYFKNEHASPEAVAVARKRLESYFKKPQTNCEPPPVGDASRAFEIDVHRVFPSNTPL